MRRYFTIPTFARRFGFSSSRQKGFRKQLNHLIRVGALELQQSGFLGDSMHHHKLVVITDFEALNKHFQKTLTLPREIREIKVEGEHPNFSKEKRIIQFPQSQRTDEYYFRVRQIGKTLCITLTPKLASQHNIMRGDIIKAKLKQLWKAPRPDEPIRDVEEKDNWTEEEE